MRGGQRQSGGVWIHRVERDADHECRPPLFSGLSGVEGVSELVPVTGGPAGRVGDAWTCDCGKTWRIESARFRWFGNDPGRWVRMPTMDRGT